LGCLRNPWTGKEVNAPHVSAKKKEFGLVENKGKGHNLQTDTR
jgi:hypothetical protein